MTWRLSFQVEKNTKDPNLKGSDLALLVEISGIEPLTS